jgi:hypothetical protein
MKKGLLTVLLASLVLVGCQNYDDQFDDLNAQISALKSQVDGLSSLSGQVSSLSGTISGLSSGVAAAQAAATAAGASADAATAAASAIDLSGLSASLATLQTEVDAVQSSLATAATASAVTSLQSELDAIELSLADLLASSNIYSTNVSVTNATTLNAALALGNKLNVLNANLTITGYSGMSYANVQTLVDRVNTMTGNIIYTAGGSTGTEVVFNNLVSAGDITMTQPGGYHFPKLANAGTIDMKDDYETLVTRVNFPALTSATAIQTDATGTMEVIFTYATSVNFASLVTAPSNTVTITTKKDATLDLGAWLSQDATGNKTDATVALNGPASFTNGTAAGTFASTGLGGNTVGAHDGSITLTNVATAAIHNFRGTITLNAGVKNFTGNNIVNATISAATDLETVNMTQIRDNDPGLSAAAVANLSDSDDNAAQDVNVISTHTKLTSLTVTGATGDINVTSAPALTTVNLTSADAFNIDIDGNTALTSYTDASKAENFTFNNNDVMTSLNASHTTKLTATSDTGVSFAVTGNAEMTSLTIGSDDVDDLDITTNAKLATLSAASLTDNGTSTTAPVDIYDNAFVATSVKDSRESDATRAATGWAVGGSTDTGTITSNSGLSTLDTYLADALASTSTIAVWFDSVTKLETQSVYGGAYTDNTASLPTAAFTRNSAAAVDFSTSYTGYLVYMYNVDVATGTTVVSGAVDKQRVSYAYDILRNTTTQAETRTMGAGEGIEVYQNDNLLGSFNDGDAYASAANSATVETLDDLISFINADTTLDSGYNIDLTMAEDAMLKGLYTVTYTASTGAAATNGAVSTSGLLNFTFGNSKTSGLPIDLQANVTAADTSAGIVTGIIAAINADTNDYDAVVGGNTSQFYVTANVSSGSGRNTSPMATFPTLTLVPGSASTTAILVPAANAQSSMGSEQVVYANNGASTVNTSGSSNSLFSVATSKATVNGMRLTITNNGNADFGTVGAVIMTANSNTSLVSVTDVDSSISQGLMTAGTNIDTFVSGSQETSDAYVAAFSAISSGTSTTTGAVTAVLTNRTGW